MNKGWCSCCGDSTGFVRIKYPPFVPFFFERAEEMNYFKAAALCVRLSARCFSTATSVSIGVSSWARTPALSRRTQPLMRY